MGLVTDRQEREYNHTKSKSNKELEGRGKLAIRESLHARAMATSIRVLVLTSALHRPAWEGAAFYVL